jgi:colicin import membrane protein
MATKKTTKTSQFETEKNEEVRKTAAGYTVEAALKAVSSAQATIGKTLANVGEQLQTQIQELDTVKKAVELEKEELARIHGVEKIAKDIEDMEAEYVLRRQTAEDGFRSFSGDLANRQADARRTNDQALADLQSKYSRDIEQQKYQFEQQKKTQLDLFNEEVRQLRASERDHTEVLHKTWAAREEELAKHETEYATLQKQVAEFPAQLAAGIAKAEAIVGNSVKRDYTHQFELLKKDADTSQAMASSTISSLKQQLGQAETVIAQLQAKLTDAEKKVESIANKALDAASGRQALAEIQAANQSSNGASSRKA